MNRRYILATTLIIVVMLVTTQMVFLNTVKSDPTMHTGTAYVGELWVDELDVSSSVDNFDYIGISHVKKDDDWVLWEEKTGSIVANWSIDIGNNHPEYDVLFTLYVFNLDGDYEDIENTSFHKTYAEDTSYEEGGSLEISVDFSREEVPDNITLLCYLDTSVVVNNTNELANFTSYARDRSVLGVDFETPQGTPDFSKYVDEVNEEAPSMWSWIYGWNESGRFTDEDDMLNTLTFCKVGCSIGSSTTGEVTWDMGNTKEIKLSYLGCYAPPYFLERDNEEETLDYDTNGFFSDVRCKFDVKVSRTSNTLRRFVIASFHFVMENNQLAWPRNTFPNQCNAGCPNYITTEADYDLVNADISDDINDNGKINMKGWFFIFLSKPFIPRPLEYTIKIGSQGSGSSSYSSQSCFYWEGSCAYENQSYELDVDSATTLGITTVSVDITDLLEEGNSNEIILTERGDSGDTIIEFTCE